MHLRRYRPGHRAGARVGGPEAAVGMTFGQGLGDREGVPEDEVLPSPSTIAEGRNGLGDAEVGEDLGKSGV